MFETAIAFFGMGLCAGVLLANFLWRLKLRERADLGIRLEMGEKLYEIREYKRKPNGGPGCPICRPVESSTSVDNSNG